MYDIEFAKEFKEEIELDEMNWAVGGVYHQEFKNGDKVYFRADSVQKNKRWKGLSVDEFGGRQKKAKNASADEKQQGWKITPKNEIPKGLKEEVEIEEGAKFSASQINKLKTEYSKLQKIDPESPAYKKMKTALGKMSKEQLKQIKDAKIKFLQYTAGDLLRKMGEEVEIDEEVFYWYIIKGTTQKGKVWRTGTEKEMKLLLRKPTTPSGYVLAKSRKDLSSGAAWKGSMGVSEEVELDEVLKPGAKVKVPHPAKGKGMVTGKIVRYDKGGPHSPFYVVDIGEPRSEKIPAHKIKEEVEIDEARKTAKDIGMECQECGKKFKVKLSSLQYGRTKCPKCKSTDLDFQFGEEVEAEAKFRSPRDYDDLGVGSIKYFRKKGDKKAKRKSDEEVDISNPLNKIKEALTRIRSLVEKPEGIADRGTGYTTHVKKFPPELFAGLRKVIPGGKFEPEDEMRRHGKVLPGLSITLPGWNVSKLLIQHLEKTEMPKKGTTVGKIATTGSGKDWSGKDEPKGGVNAEVYRAHQMDVWIDKAAELKDFGDEGKSDWYPLKEFDGVNSTEATKKVIQFLKTKVKRMAKEEVEIDERKSKKDYELYHKTYSDAVQHAADVAKKQGYEVDQDSWDSEISFGQRKPSKGKTVSKKVELTKGGKSQKKKLHIQVYGMDSGKYELNMYIESKEVEIEEEVTEKDYDSLKRGDTVTIEYKGGMSSGKGTFKVTAKNIVGKAKVGKVTLQNVKNPRGVKYFLYKRGNKVSFAIGDMGASVVSYTKEEVEVNEGTSLQVKMALDDVGLKGTWKNGKVYVKKRDVKKAEKALKGNVIYKGKPPVVVGENFYNKIREVIDLKKSSMGTVIKDFQDSDAPQFNGKSDKKRREMAIAAKMAADRNESVKEDEKDDPKSKKKDKVNLKPKMDEKMAKTYKEMLKHIKDKKSTKEEVKEAVTDSGVEYGEQDWDTSYRLDHTYPNLGVNYAEFHEQGLEGPYQIDGAAYFFDRKVGSWYSMESEDYVDDDKAKELSFRYVKHGLYKPQFSN